MQQGGRRDKLLQPERQDVYRNRGKYAEPTVCSRCQAVFHEGRWTWGAAPPGAQRAVCPACQRAADRLPAGTIELGGPFFHEHREEILNLVRNEETAEKKERPLERIMEIGAREAGALVTTTGVHLARRIGEALARSYQGAFDFRYGENEEFIRVSWTR